MSIRNAAVAVGLFFIIACSGDGLTQLDDSTLQVQAPLMSQGATGAVAGPLDPRLLFRVDREGNQDFVVCVKTVPEGKGKAGTRIIVKDNTGGECPGGFDEIFLGAG